MARSKSNYFGLKTSTDLYLKLRYDIKRLKAGKSSEDIQFAAIDAAVTANHILDWVLVELKPAAYFRLTGQTKGSKKKDPKESPIQTFIETNQNQLKAIEYCRIIANALKHKLPKLGGKMEGMNIGHHVRLTWTAGKMTGALPVAYIQLKPDGEKVNALELFEEMAEQWYDFLVREGLWVEQPPDWDE